METRKTIYDLEGRTANFAEKVVNFAKLISVTEVTKSIITQLVRAGTSIGANYCEADCAETRKDFEHKIGICKKESKETKFWLELIEKTIPSLKNDSSALSREANELNLIFSTIIIKSKKNNQI